MKRKTREQKELQGTFRPGEHKTRANYAATNGAKAPAYVRANKIAHAEWKRVVPHLEAEGVLRETDLSLLASYCLLFARWRQASAEVEKGQVLLVTSTTRTGKTERPISNPAIKNEVLFQNAMLRTAVRFGLTPLDRPRVEASPAESEEMDAFERFLAEG